MPEPPEDLGPGVNVTIFHGPMTARGKILICRESRASFSMMRLCRHWKQISPAGAGSKVGPEPLPIGNMTLSDGHGSVERTLTRRSVGKPQSADMPYEPHPNGRSVAQACNIYPRDQAVRKLWQEVITGRYHVVAELSGVRGAGGSG